MVVLTPRTPFSTVVDAIATKSETQTVSLVLTTISTWYDLFDAGTTVDTQTPASFDTRWSSNAECLIEFFLDMANITGTDVIQVEFLQGTTRAAFYEYNAATITDKGVPLQVLCTSTYGIKGRIQRTSATARTFTGYFHGVGRNRYT